VLSCLRKRGLEDNVHAQQSDQFKKKGRAQRRLVTEY